MSATSLDLSQIKTDALSAASTFRTLIGLGTGNTPTFLGATLTGGTVTASAPLIDGTQTWNNAATVFTGMRLNVVDTASSSSSLLMDLQVGGSSRVSVDKSGRLILGAAAAANPIIVGAGAGGQLHFNTQNISGRVSHYMDYLGTLKVANNGNPIGWDTSNTTAGGVNLAAGWYCPTSNIIEQRNATAAQRFNLYGTFTNSSNYERMFMEYNTTGTAYRIGTEKAGTGSARALELQTDGTTRLTIGSTGIATFSSRIDCTAVWVNASENLAEFTHLTRLSLRVGGGGYSVVRLGGVYQSDNTLITIGGTASSFPAIKRNAAALNFRLADDSADCDITAAALTLSGNLTISTKDIVTDTTTGTKIGTATTQKIGFYNKAPVVQPAAVADATDAASVITQLNLLLGRMRDLGLIAT